MAGPRVGCAVSGEAKLPCVAGPQGSRPLGGSSGGRGAGPGLLSRLHPPPVAAGTRAAKSAALVPQVMLNTDDCIYADVFDAVALGTAGTWRLGTAAESGRRAGAAAALWAAAVTFPGTLTHFTGVPPTTARRCTCSPTAVAPSRARIRPRSRGQLRTSTADGQDCREGGLCSVRGAALLRHWYQNKDMVCGLPDTLGYYSPRRWRLLGQGSGQGREVSCV